MNIWEYLDRNAPVGFAFVVGLFLTAIFFIFASLDKHNTRVYALNGYQQVQMQGSSYTMWVKK